MNQVNISGNVLATFTAYGDPKAQPRPRAFAKAGKVRMYDPSTAEHWKSQIAFAAQDFIPPAPHNGPLLVTLEFLFNRPKAHYKSNGILRDKMPLLHEKKPDIDNLTKAVLDALTAVGMWDDDKQVAAMSLVKRYVVDAERAGVAVNVASLGGVGKDSTAKESEETQLWP